MKILVISIVAFAIAASAPATIGVVPLRLQNPNARVAWSVSDSIWKGSWVFETRGTQRSAIGALDNTQGSHQSVGPISIHLEDGTIGSISAIAGSCGPQDFCSGSRDDCGCFEDDSYWILISDANDRQIKRLHLWAAYGLFQIVPVDITGGPGDELLIFRVPAHSAPPIGYDIKIWQIDREMPLELANNEHVAGHLPAVAMAVSCSFWRTLFFVNPDTAKPHPLSLQIDVTVSPDCPASETALIKVDRLQPGELLRFDSIKGKYVFPPGSIPSTD